MFAFFFIKCMALNLIAELIIIIIGLHNQNQYHFSNVTFLEQDLYNLLRQTSP